MKKLFLLFFALLPSVASADGVNRPVDDSGAPAIVNPCVKDDGSSPVISEGMNLAMRLPTMVVTYAINAGSVTEGPGMVTPCPTDRMNKPGGKEEPAASDSWNHGFDSDYSTLIIGD